jgi:cobalt-precorrin-7 (C5)-methyltransferase
MLTVDAIDRLRAATKVFGSERAIAIARPFIPASCQVNRITNYSTLGDLPDDAVLLSTGDPMLAGLGHLGTEVVPGISSMQCAFSRLRLPLAKAVVVDAHGKDEKTARHEIADELARGRIPYVLTGPGFDLDALASFIADKDHECTVIVLENLGYPNESISFGTARRPPSVSSRLFSLVLIREP